MCILTSIPTRIEFEGDDICHDMVKRVPSIYIYIYIYIYINNVCHLLQFPNLVITIHAYLYDIDIYI